VDQLVKRSASSCVYSDAEHRYCEVFVDEYHLPDGTTTARHRIRIGGGRTGVVVIARRGDDVLLVRQWRPTIQRWMLELPRGFGEEQPIADALRELREETGLIGSDAASFGIVDVDSGSLENQVEVVRVTVRADADLVPGAGEIAEARWWKSDELVAAIVGGEIRDALSLAALALASAEHGLSLGSVLPAAG
jgi:8-oxo-dGTP pyrophosphatase MutT (NUDIX family)